jgi:hypothetical protein
MEPKGRARVCLVHADGVVTRMSRYSDDEKAAVRRRSRELLAWEPREPAAEERAAIDFPPLEDPVERWRREADEATARRASLQAEQRGREREEREAAMARSKAESDADWNAWAQGHIERERAFMTDVVGEALAEVRKELRDEFAEQIRELRAELTKQRSGDAGGVIRKIRIQDDAA